jgi:hypothetical protein
VLPVWEYQGWQVETVMADLSSGLTEQIEIRHGASCWHVATPAERDALLIEHGVDPGALTEATTVEDGCE